MRKDSDFWGDYTECLRREGIPEGKIRWYLRWADTFSRSLKGVPLKERSIEDVTRFLDDLKADEGTVPWQVEQAQSALGILYRKHLGLDPAQMPTKRAGAAQDSVSQPRQLEALHGELLDQVRTAIRVKHFSGRTEEAYLSWIRRFIAFHDLRSPLELNESHIRAYLGYLATEKAVASSTQNQALNALVFLYAKVLMVDLGDFSDFVRARTPKRVPISL